VRAVWAARTRPRTTLTGTIRRRSELRRGDGNHHIRAAVVPRGRHANALQHAFSRIGRELGAQRRADLVARIESYRRGADPLSVPVAILAHYASDGQLPWLAGQTYLEPFPAALRLRHNVPR
jgi:uncharacterized protein YbgA (DUF1722 family)